MPTVGITETFAATVHEAERLWYDTDRWSDWVDGFDRVDEITGDWPCAGAVVNWISGPAGRGHVSERAIEYEPLHGQTIEVADDSIQGQQRIEFAPSEAGVSVSLVLTYALRRRNPLTAVVDMLFIRRAMADSLRVTLSRFGAMLELVSARRP